MSGLLNNRGFLKAVSTQRASQTKSKPKRDGKTHPDVMLTQFKTVVDYLGRSFSQFEEKDKASARLIEAYNYLVDKMRRRGLVE